ncbi:hypothetical protein BT96DRAFT_211819 [Gymnopus androsaceus JB14]|uniref:F-box domain-containing protein n=1 Tax=Gymnopus androsaceus JB14 TaxID=1447944 RepID=A0A6A4H9E5_9AGAR|nr:hypothetical protein BT96DRAFT_211819 [Gymnopus androsaceus JB14]
MLFASQRKFPELRQLQISSSENSPAIGFREEWHHPRFFVTCPKLRSLVVRNIDIALRFTQPCDGVEYIALQGISSACAALILGNCLNVQDIILNVTRAESSEWEPHTFHRARMLEIRSLKNRMGPMLDSFTMPELTDLLLYIPNTYRSPFYIYRIVRLIPLSQSSFLDSPHPSFNRLRNIG